MLEIKIKGNIFSKFRLIQKKKLLLVYCAMHFGMMKTIKPI